MHKIQRTRYGYAENPTGAHITWKVRDRTYLCECVGFYVRDVPAAVMLRTRHLNGEQGPDVAIGAVMVLDREFESADPEVRK
jgi:hypothetical protein